MVNNGRQYFTNCYIAGRVDFSASNTGQFQNTNGSNIGSFSVNYNVAAITNALTFVNDLNAGWGGQTGTNVSISGNTTIDASTGMLDTIIVDGHTDRRCFQRNELQPREWTDHYDQ